MLPECYNCTFWGCSHDKPLIIFTKKENYIQVAGHIDLHSNVERENEMSNMGIVLQRAVSTTLRRMTLFAFVTAFEIEIYMILQFLYRFISGAFSAYNESYDEMRNIKWTIFGKSWFSHVHAFHLRWAKTTQKYCRNKNQMNILNWIINLNLTNPSRN